MSTSETPTHLLSVPDISCGHCKSSIESAVGEVELVDNVEVDVATKTVSVVGGDYDQVVAAIDEAGYSVAPPS